MDRHQFELDRPVREHRWRGETSRRRGHRLRVLKCIGLEEGHPAKRGSTLSLASCSFFFMEVEFDRFLVETRPPSLSATGDGVLGTVAETSSSPSQNRSWTNLAFRQGSEGPLRTVRNAKTAAVTLLFIDCDNLFSLPCPSSVKMIVLIIHE